MKRSLIVIDTSIVVALNTPADAHHDRVTRWFRSLGESSLALPAPALVELLAGRSSAEEADSLGRNLAAKFQIVALDQMAAREAGLLAASGGVAMTVKAIKEASPGVRKEQVKTDLMILGCALRSGGTLYTVDGPLRALAARLKLDEKVADVPAIAEQPSLPGLTSE